MSEPDKLGFGPYQAELRFFHPDGRCVILPCPMAWASRSLCDWKDLWEGRGEWKIKLSLERCDGHE